MLFNELYQKTLADNEKHLRSWEDYLNNLKSLDLNVYAEKLKVPTLVPIGSRIFFRGELKHTNEVTVSLGADHFVKCSIAQAEILRQHRIKDAQSKVDAFKKEQNYFENKFSFTKQNVLERDGQEIVEVYTEEEDQAWREKHKDNVKKYMQEKAKKSIETKTELQNDKTDEELWERLEELELQEELENEMLDNYNEIVDKKKENQFLASEETLLLNSFKKETNKPKDKTNKGEDKEKELKEEPSAHQELNSVGTKVDITDVKETSNVELLQQVLNKQNELENKLHELKYKEREQTKTEQDLLSRLDELEQLDELEDEIDRLDATLETENTDSEDTDSDDDVNKENSLLKRSISFADEDTETVEITFNHDKTEPNKSPYSTEQGIIKPSDVYDAYAYLFNNKTTSILKKSKYGNDSENVKVDTRSKKQVNFAEPAESKSQEPEEVEIPRTIVIKDVVEKSGGNPQKIEGGARPTSLFKKKRLQNKA